MATSWLSQVFGSRKTDKMQAAMICKVLSIFALGVLFPVAHGQSKFTVNLTINFSIRIKNFHVQHSILYTLIFIENFANTKPTYMIVLQGKCCKLEHLN